MKSQLPNIYEYNDFRKYLADYQRARQSTDKSFTKSHFSQSLMLPNTRSYFTDVLKGKKVTSTFAERFVNVMGLDKEQAQFFRVLIKFNQAENLSEREIYFEQLISLNRTPKKVIDKKTYSYYKNWYNSAIRALLYIYDFEKDYARLAKKIFPPISTKQAKESIALLKELHLITKNEHGYYKPTEKSITTSDYIRDEIILQYQLKCLELAKSAILKNKKQKQLITTNTISISENGLNLIEKKIQKFRSEIRSLVHKDENKADKVYQLDILMFPNSK